MLLAVPANPVSQPGVPNSWIERLIERKATSLLHLLTANVPEIAALGVIGCGFMVILTGDANRWLGRAMMIFWVAAAWRLIT